MKHRYQKLLFESLKAFLSYTKILNLMITELFYSHILNMNRGPSIKGVSVVHASLFLVINELTVALWVSRNGPSHLKANKARFLPNVVICSKSLLGLSLPLSLLSTHSARHCTRVFLIFSSNFTSQFCGRGEAGITDNRGTTSSKRPSMAMTCRR